MSEHFLKLYIYLKNHKYNNLDCQYIFWNRLHYLQSFNAQNLIQIKSPFVCLQYFNFLNGQSFLFFQIFFSLSNVHYSFSKLKVIFTLMTKRTKEIEIGKIHFYNTFNTWFKCVFGLKIYEVWWCGFNKKYSFLNVKAMNR